ncbi:MAG: CYTH domain-containing protein, partial [Nocardioidaceae bacterium]
MSQVVHEVESKYEPAAETTMPELSGLAGVEGVHDLGEQQLEATYFDTAELALAAAGVTLRRRTGGDDAGWHLKIPAGDGRDELREPLG